ncbi:protein phosphatase 2C domain-containing protein [uncultured Gimesia sp.]|jgi:serine/threonine protein phosphatase PrpC|uniref:PP2C family protein-serine/threonine phosphatase n=1 Tax=uncultured Gimesia sp. TaxID=1678688 RepID=UPI0026205172|nr:protein phosphatase 2C domain-containing protein [uncultured Gimesia sp.]
MGLRTQSGLSSANKTGLLMVGIRYGTVSITGNFRENNEDNYYIDSLNKYFLVADGMGGQSAGEKASQLAIELIPKKLNQLIDFENGNTERVIPSIDEAVSHANAEIMALGEVDPSCRSMGTTIVFVVQAGEKFFIGGVGDSRVYLLRNNTLHQLTTDHSLTQALVDAGTITPEEALTHRYKNVLYRYLGTKDGSAGTQTRQLDPLARDRILLCSDGVTDGISDEKLQEFLGQFDDPQKTAEEIVKTAQEGGSKDNITCIVLFID